MSGSWSQIEIGGKKADIFEPAVAGEPKRVVLHLHGHGLETLSGKPAFTEQLSQHGFYAICPHGQRSWWLDRVCTEFDSSISPRQHLLEQVLPEIERRWGVTPPAVGLTGISMGGQGALQLAYQNPHMFPVVAAISPAVDFHNWVGQGLPLDDMFASKESARQETATLNVHPLNWPRHQLLVCDPADIEWFEGVDRLTMKLSSSGIPFESDLQTTNGGHCWEYFEAMAPQIMQFVASRLKQEQERF